MTECFPVVCHLEHMVISYYQYVSMHWIFPSSIHSTGICAKQFLPSPYPKCKLLTVLNLPLLMVEWTWTFERAHLLYTIPERILKSTVKAWTIVRNTPKFRDLSTLKNLDMKNFCKTGKSLQSSNATILRLDWVNQNKCTQFHQMYLIWCDKHKVLRGQIKDLRTIPMLRPL
jgi:hypothetical protein